MEFAKTMKLYRKMCDSMGDTCADCPIWFENGTTPCRDWIIENPDKAEELILDWHGENRKHKRNLEEYTNALLCKCIEELNAEWAYVASGAVMTGELLEVFTEAEADKHIDRIETVAELVKRFT